MNNGDLPITGQKSYSIKGLTKREHFAAMAMQGLLANSNVIDLMDTMDSTVSEQAVDCADKLLKELDK